MVKIGGHTNERGYLWKYCPYSTNHRNKYYLNGFHGNTNDPTILAVALGDLSSFVTSDHPYTNGTMNMRLRAGSPGWICYDDDCVFFIDNGVRYFEL